MATISSAAFSLMQRQPAVTNIPSLKTGRLLAVTGFSSALVMH